VKNNIVLIGFMGVGKGTISRKLVQKSDYFAIDTDDVIESLENKTIKAIFEKHGESYFRALEQRCATWLQKSVDHTIISTGGGFYKVEGLNAIGKVVYLKADFDWIYDRVVNAKNAKKKLKKRPLFKSYKKTKELFDARAKAYEAKADIVVNVDSISTDAAIQQILKA
jgi:shikimate kinase